MEFILVYTTAHNAAKTSLVLFNGEHVNILPCFKNVYKQNRLLAEISAHCKKLSDSVYSVISCDAMQVYDSYAKGRRCKLSRAIDNILKK